MSNVTKPPKIRTHHTVRCPGRKVGYQVLFQSIEDLRGFPDSRRPCKQNSNEQKMETVGEIEKIECWGMEQGKAKLNTSKSLKSMISFHPMVMLVYFDASNDTTGLGY